MTQQASIEVRDGKVILSFGGEWVALEPQTALEVGEVMARAAYTCTYGKVPEGTQNVLKQEKVNMLYRRVELVFKNLMDRKKSHKHIAHELVDIVLAEVT